MSGKHSSARAKEIAEQGTILLTTVGSELYGVSTGDGDIDRMGICIEPRECVIGLEEFEQYQFRTQPEGVRSGVGDLDLTIYSLRKWSRLAAQGNPSVLLLLFAPYSQWVSTAPARWGIKVQDSGNLFISKQCGQRFIGYLDSQKEQMLGLRSKHTNRPELIEKYGLDTKFAYHALRLGIQGIELLTEGHINLPMHPADCEYLKLVRNGVYTKDEVLQDITRLREQLVRVVDESSLPDKPDYGKINDWLIEMHQTWWNS